MLVRMSCFYSRSNYPPNQQIKLSINQKLSLSPGMLFDLSLAPCIFSAKEMISQIALWKHTQPTHLKLQQQEDGRKMVWSLCQFRKFSRFYMCHLSKSLNSGEKQLKKLNNNNNKKKSLADQLGTGEALKKIKILTWQSCKTSSRVLENSKFISFMKDSLTNLQICWILFSFCVFRLGILVYPFCNVLLSLTELLLKREGKKSFNTALYFHLTDNLSARPQV